MNASHYPENFGIKKNNESEITKMKRLAVNFDKFPTNLADQNLLMYMYEFWNRSSIKKNGHRGDVGLMCKQMKVFEKGLLQRSIEELKAAVSYGCTKSMVQLADRLMYGIGLTHER